MQTVRARGVANAVERVLDLGLNEAATELHCRVLCSVCPSPSISSSPCPSSPSVGFHIVCVSATPRTRARPRTLRGVSSLLSSLHRAAALVQYIPDAVTTGFKILVEGWESAKYVSETYVTPDLGQIVEAVRTRVQAIALVNPGISWTVYDQTTKRFVFKSLCRDNELSKAVEFFGGVDVELVMPLDETCNGWWVSGHTVLPPVGHPTRSRQRMYFHGKLVEDWKESWVCDIVDRVEALYRDAYAGAARQLVVGRDQPDQRQLAVVRKGLNAHPMFILEIEMANVDARRQAGGVLGALGSVGVPDAVESVERAFLAAWTKTLTGRLLRLLEQGSRQERGLAGRATGGAAGGSKESRIVRVVMGAPSGGGRTGRSDGSDGCGQIGLQYTENDAEANYKTSEAHVHVPNLFDDLDGSRHLDDRGPPVSPDLRHLPKKRRSLAGIQAIEAIFDRNTHIMGYTSGPVAAKPADTAILMPHTATRSAFSLPVVTSTTLQPIQPPVTRHDLANAPRVLGQIDRKFIAFVTPNGTIGIIDQHAADERVRLERLLRDVMVLKESRGNDRLGHEGRNSSKTVRKPHPASIHAHRLPDPITLRIGDDEDVLFQRHAQAAIHWGWKWTWCPMSHHGSHREMQITHVPCLFGTRTLSAADLKLYIYQLSSVNATVLAANPEDPSHCVDSSHTVVPDAVHRTLASIACRGAIMFGDQVTEHAAAMLISRLSCAKQYYECAHGRPTVAGLWSAKKNNTAGAGLERPDGPGHESRASKKTKDTFLTDLCRKLKSEIISS